MAREKGINPSFQKFMIVHPKNLKAGNMFGLCHYFKVCMGARYLGSYIRDDESKRDWLKERTETWERNICMIRKTAGKYTQESYAAVERAIQS